MKSTIKVHRDQNLVDVALQEYGAVTGLVQLAKENSLSVGDSPGEQLTIDTESVVQAGTRDFFQVRRLKVATGRTAHDDIGIGEMIIETNFIIR